MQHGEGDDQHRDTGTSESRQHGVYVEDSTQKGKRTRNVATDILSYYHARDIIEQRQDEAGHIWYKDWMLSGFKPGLSLKFERVSGSREEMSDKQATAFVRYREAEAAIRTKRHQAIAWEICIAGCALKEIVKAHHPYYTTPNQLMPLLREALDDLARFYGLPGTPIDSFERREIKN